MKKLAKISLKDAVVLDDKQMKQLFGGSGCQTTCVYPSGNEYALGVNDCNGTCMTDRGKSVTCTMSNGETFTKMCPKTEPTTPPTSGSLLNF